MKIPQYFNGKIVGILNTETGVYSRIITKNQMFLHPKYEGMLAISQSILRNLIVNGWKKNEWWIIEWDKKPFLAIITKEDFLRNMEEIYFEGRRNCDKQYGVRLYFWKRLYS